MNPALDSRARFEAHWRAVRGAKKAANELRRHPADQQVYINDSANRHFVTWGEAWQAAIASMAAERPQNCGTGYCSCIECPYPTVVREFTNELGNAIRITVEGPRSMHENIVTPMEAEQLRSALNEHARPGGGDA